MKTYGSKAAQVGKENLGDIACSYCNSKGTVDMYFFYRYYHFFGIPMFPHRRGGAMMCSKCKHVTNAKLLPLDLKDRFVQEKKKYRPPLWQYMGGVTLTVLIILYLGIKLITYGTMSLNNFMDGIKKDKVYKYAVSKSSYTFWKISRVNKDSIYYLPSNFVFSGTPPGKIDFNQPDFFDSTERLYLRSEIKKDFEGKKIRSYSK